MDIHLYDQTKHFKAHLSRLSKKAVMEYDASRLRHTTTSVVVQTQAPFNKIDLGFFFDYLLFPPAIMTSYAQWTADRRAMAPGDVIVQQVQIPPVGFAPKIVMGVRIKDVIRQPERIGYSYETLAGHVERGISSFIIEEVAGIGVKFVIETFSEPALTVGRVLAPVFTTPYKRYCTRKALNNVEAQIRGQI